jgi:hypothetical protein
VWRFLSINFKFSAWLLLISVSCISESDNGWIGNWNQTLRKVVLGRRWNQRYLPSGNFFNNFMWKKMEKNDATVINIIFEVGVNNLIINWCPSLCFFFRILSLSKANMLLLLHTLPADINARGLERLR